MVTDVILIQNVGCKMPSFTVFDICLLTLNKERFNKWLYEKKLLIDFSSTICQFCGAQYKKTTVSSYSEGVAWACNNRSCRTLFSIKKGSFFELSHLSKETIIKLTYFWCRNYSNKLASHETGVSEHTIVDWFQFCRDVCVDLLDSELGLGIASDIIGGQGVVVEIDESKFGKRKYNRGKYIEGVWVFGGIERDRKENCFYCVVRDRTAETLLDLIKKHIRPGSHIISDCWPSYNQIENLGLGYKHDTVNHSKNFKDPETGACTNHIENSWLCLKKSKHGQGFAKTLLPSYFAEFIFRRKFLQTAADPFAAFLTEGLNRFYTLERAKNELEKTQLVNQEKAAARKRKRTETVAPVATTSASAAQSSPAIDVVVVDETIQNVIVMNYDSADDFE